MTVSGENLIVVDHDGSDSGVVFGGECFEKDKDNPQITIIELATSEFHHKQVIIE